VTALAFLLALVVAAAPGPAAVAVVVGSNQSPSPELPNLRYADDDAIQNARTLALLGAAAELLVSPDEETRDLFPAVRPAGPATRDALAAAIDRAFAALDRLRRAGRSTRFYFFFAGHGDTALDRPYLQMDDGRLWRDDLAQLLRRSPAEENHLVIDACNASLFVGSRGPGGDREPVRPGFSRTGGPAWPPGTGLLTARSAGGQTHEWTEFQAGIFSHEVRSGLLGAADADLDGRVTYRELGAFVARANQAVVNHKYRPEVVAAPPGGDLDAVFALLPDGPLVLELDRDLGHAFVESENGVRVADLHPVPGLRLKLRLPTDLGALFVERPEGRAAPSEMRLEPRAGHVQLSSLGATPPRARARGAAHEAFLQLFTLPFDAASVERFRAEAELDSRPVPRRDRPGWLPMVVAGTGAGAAAVGAGLGISGYLLASQARAGSGEERQRLAPRIDARNRAAVITGVAGLVASAVGVAWALWWRER
jgi:hypothetical protein